MIETHDGKVQMVCDSCPTSFGKPWPDGAFSEMVKAARAAGWRIMKRMEEKPDATTADLFGAPPRIAGQTSQPFTHTCPACVAAGNERARLL